MATLVDVVNAQNETVDRCELPEAIFAAPVKPHVLHEVVRMQLARRRQGTADTKGRSEVSGGGKKPWKQKGTGRARAGTTRSPLWRHGGTVFGPHPRSYAYEVPKAMRRQALLAALTSKAQAGAIRVLESLSLERPSTKAMVGLLKGAGVAGKRWSCCRRGMRCWRSRRGTCRRFVFSRSRGSTSTTCSEPIPWS